MKKTKAVTGPKKIEETSKMQEPDVYYGKLRGGTALKALTYADFKKTADKVSFTQAEWADILHISERTLQRYAKDNHVFAPGNAERLVLVEKVIQQAKLTFGKTDNLYTWLKRNPYMLEGNLSMRSLNSFEGIQQVLTQLGRIQHGIFA
ncbi:MAG: antitoxin Xre-like helix-turn-helix domain-containing protein [Ferruginibacter sp.]